MLESFNLDKATILARLGGDEEIFTVMATMYLEDVDNYCRQISEALVRGEAAQLQREAHTIKGLLATFADQEGSDMAMAIERQAKEGGCAGLEEAVARVRERLQLVAAALRNLDR